MNKYALPLILLSMLGAPVAASQAAELGRLFYTPQQRQQMDRHDTSSTEDGSRRNYIVVNGVVQKRGGNRTVWINGTAQEAERSNDKPPAAAPVTVPGKSRPVQLKVGQRMMLDTTAPNASEEDK